MKLLLLSGIIFLSCNLAMSAEPVAPPDAPETELAPAGDDMAADTPMPPDNEMQATDEGFVTKILEKIKKDNPEEAAKLEKLQKDNPKQFRIELRKYCRQCKMACEGNEPNRCHFRGDDMQGNMPGPDGQRGQQGPMGGKEGIRQQIQEKETELMTWLNKNDPNEAKELKALKETDARAYARRMMFEMKTYRDIMFAEQTNPALAEVLKKDLVLKQKRNELLDQIKAATDETKKKELTVQLKDVLGQRFDLIVQKKQLRYEELKTKLVELQKHVNESQAELENIKTKKAEQVDKYLDKLLNQSEEIDWN